MKRKPRKEYSAEENIRIVLDALHSWSPIAALCRIEDVVHPNGSLVTSSIDKKRNREKVEQHGYVSQTPLAQSRLGNHRYGFSGYIFEESV